MTAHSVPTPNNNPSVTMPPGKRIWGFCLVAGVVLWGIGIGLWLQKGIDDKVLFYFNEARIAHGPGISLMVWLSSSGLAVLSGIYVLYLLASQFSRGLDVPKTIYFYTICSFGISGIAGDLVQKMLARPRPLVTYGQEIFVLSDALAPSIPSGHATKCVALAIPFILLVLNKNNLHRAIKGIMIVLAGGVCLSRIVLGAHYVSDVLAGIGMGIIGLPFTMLFANLILKRVKPERLPVMSIVWGVLLVLLTIIFMTM